MGTHKKRSKIFTIVILLIGIAFLYSLLPVIGLYIQKTPSIFNLNERIAKNMEKNEGRNFAFIVMSDTSSGCFVMESTTLKIISRINAEDRFKKIPIDFVINIGDVTFRGKESHYRNYTKIRSRIKYPTISAIGNHDDDIDDGAKGLGLFHKYCGENEFSFTDRNCYFIVLDNKNGNVSESQFEWLKSELKKSEGYEHTFVFAHKPPFNPYQQSWYRTETNPWSLKFMNLCEKYNVDMVFSGHEYVNRVVDFGGVKYAVSGGAGAILFEAPRRDNSFHHYYFVKINGDYVDYEVREVLPPIWEYLTLYLGKDIYYFIKDLLN